VEPLKIEPFREVLGPLGELLNVTLHFVPVIPD
jgi:hypothetical protein